MHAAAGGVAAESPGYAVATNGVILSLEGQPSERAHEIEDPLDRSRTGDQPQLTSPRSAQVVGGERYMNAAPVHKRQPPQIEHDRAAVACKARDRVFERRSAGQIQFALQPQLPQPIANDSLQTQARRRSGALPT